MGPFRKFMETQVLYANTGVDSEPEILGSSLVCLPGCVTLDRVTAHLSGSVSTRENEEFKKTVFTFQPNSPCFFPS